MGWPAKLAILLCVTTNTTTQQILSGTFQAFKFGQTKNHKPFLCPIVCSKSWYTDGNVSNSGPLCREFKCWTNYGTKHYSMNCWYSEEESGIGVFGFQIPIVKNLSKEDFFPYQIFNLLFVRGMFYVATILPLCSAVCGHLACSSKS